MKTTYAIKGDEKILVTPENKDSLVGYKFVSEELGEKESQLQALKTSTAEKIYAKYSKESQTTLLYKAFFTFASRILEIEAIKSEFTEEELMLLGTARSVFTDMSKDIAEYEERKIAIEENSEILITEKI